ncbi:hypothetical protein [Actinophytocola sp. NPDC049390]|uniref:hypothetical protein n=1 Tax=Actinophytocola sp. NPDC049390 TaxID=3363894 RepID=UPI0037B27123
MDERELRAVMDRAVAVAPPPMSDEPVLTAARHTLKWRRAVFASVGSAAVVAVVAAGVAVLAPTRQDDGGVRVGAPPALSHEDKAAALAAALDDVAPAGYGTPGDLKGVDDYADRTLKNHEAVPVDGVWNYGAATPLTKGDGVGELLATVYPPAWGATGAGCALTPTAWDATAADCTEVTVDGREVAVADVTYPDEDGLPPAQWAGYRHADGTVVFVMQTAQVPRSGRPGLDAMPMTGRELAEVAVDPRLRPQ